MSLTRTAVFLLCVSIVAGQLGNPHGAAVHCGSKGITISIEKAYVQDFQLGDLRFSDTSCPEARFRTENATHFIMQVSLVGCGTQSSENNKSILYSNVVRQRPVGNEVINRLSILRIPFTCSYPKEASASLEQMKVNPRESRVESINGKGGFNLQMTIFKDESFAEGYGPAEFPLKLTLNTPIYIQLAVDSPDDRLSIIADSCYATPTPNAKDMSKYYIIDDSCPSDTTYKRHGGPANTQRFSFKSFKFVNGDDGQIYLHCKVFVCNKTDPNSPCAQGCVNGDALPTHKRLRRSVVQQSFELDKGPIEFVAEGKEAQQSSSVATSQVTTWVLVGMAAVCVLCLLGIIYSRYQLKAVKRAVVDRETNV